MGIWVRISWALAGYYICNAGSSQFETETSIPLPGTQVAYLMNYTILVVLDNWN